MKGKKLEREKRRKGFDRRGIIAALLFVFSIFALRYVARADVDLLAGNGESLFIGDKLVIFDYFDNYELEKVQPDSIQYVLSEESQKKECISLDSDGRVTALSQGNAVIEINYTETETQTPHQELFTVTVLAPEQVFAEYGSIVWLSAFNMYNPYFSNLPEAEAGCRYTFSNDSAVLLENGEGVFIRGFHDIEVFLERDGLKISVAKITVILPKFTQKRMARALGTKAFYPEMENYIQNVDSDLTGEEAAGPWNLVWKSEDEKIAALSEEGFLPVALGSVKLKAEFMAENGDTHVLELVLTVTDPKFTKEYIVLATDGTKKLPLAGTCADTTVLAEASVFEVGASNKIRGVEEGVEDAMILVDGRELLLRVVVTNPHYEENTLTMYKSLKKNLPIKGLNKEYSTITYTSANKNIATVTATGKVTAKKVGTVKIKIKADGRTFPVWVEISTKTGYQAAKKEIAISNTKTKYSQARRMSKGYYDCSSLVSRVYRQYGVYFGSKSGWSPTAAGIGQWCTGKNKVIAKKGVAYTKLVPGDLVFYSYTKNGRYRNISHVEMYVGNGMSVSASSSNNRVIHYGYRPDSAVLIARPTK